MACTIVEYRNLESGEHIWRVKGYTRIVAEKFATMSAQLVSLADVYDALISERCYKAAYSKEEAFHMKKVRLFM